MITEAGLLKTSYLAHACVLRGERPVSGNAMSIQDCLVREMILITDNSGKLYGVPDGLYVYNAVHSQGGSGGADTPSFVDDVDIIKFVLQTANFSLVHSRCAMVPGTMYSHTPKVSPKLVGAFPGSSWLMVDFIPLFCIVNMESENERISRLSRVAREAGAWDAAMREYRDKFKPKMTVPQTPASRSISGSVGMSGPFGSCRQVEQSSEPSQDLAPVKFTLDTPLMCGAGSKTAVSAARFFITFQHPEEIKSETPSILSLVLIGHTEEIEAGQAKSEVACARELLSFELSVIRGVYGNSLRSKEDAIEMVYEREGQLALLVTTPRWRIVSFVSPPSGKGEAVPTWTVTLLPVLYCGRFATLGIVTTRRGHAEDIVADSAPSEGKKGHVFTEHDILVSVGGDGVAHEICNGIARRNQYESLALQSHTRYIPEKTERPLSQQEKRDLEDPEQQAARRHQQEVWSDVPVEDPTGHYVVPQEILSRTPYVALVAAGSGCALAKEVEVENFIVSALTLLHLRPQTLDIYRMDPFDIPESAMRATNARFAATEAERSAIKLRNSIEGSTSFSKAAETPVRFGMLALMFAAVNEVDKGSENMRWMGNTRFTVKTMAMIVSGVPLYRVYFRYSSDKFYHPDVRVPKHNEQFNRSYVPGPATDVGCTEWVTSPNFRVSFMSINNIRLVARDICFAPFARPCDGFMDSLYVGPSEYDSSDPNYKLRVRRRDAVDFFTKTEVGTHVEDAICSYGKCRRVQVIPIDGNVMADGEVMNKTGITVSCVRGGLIVLASPGMKWDN